jgi:exonuclease VII small subunit
MTKQPEDFNYQKTKAQLNDLLIWFESGDVSVDEAIIKYQQAQILLDQLESYLKDSRARLIQLHNKVNQFKAYRLLF